MWLCRCVYGGVGVYKPRWLAFLVYFILMQEHKQKLYNTSSCCGRHIESNHILQPSKYPIINVNRITYSMNRIIKNKSGRPLDLYIKLGPYKFSLQASVDHHGYSMNSGRYTASIVVGKHFTVTIITSLNVISRIPIVHLLPIYTFEQTHLGMLGRQCVLKDVCRRWHCRVSTDRPWRMGADRLPWCRHMSLYNR